VAAARRAGADLRPLVGVMRTRTELPPGIAADPGADVTVALLNDEAYVSRTEVRAVAAGRCAWRSSTATASPASPPRCSSTNPDFTDNRLHETLAPERRPGDTDPGAASPPRSFNAPMLRDLRNSAPYMHNGIFESLREVVEFYDRRSSVAPLGLTDQEIDDMVAFLDEL
jgi:hypothetical protein